MRLIGPALRANLSVETMADFEIAPRPEFQGHQMTGTNAHAFAEVVSRYPQVLAVVALAAHNETDVRIFRVPVVDGDPFELRSKNPLGLDHEIAGERLEDRQLVGIVRGHDEA